jgi:hypothetical protein
MFKCILITIAIILVLVILLSIILVWRKNRKQEPENDDPYVRVKTPEGIKIGRLYSVNYRTNKVWVKIDDRFDFYPMSDVEIIKHESKNNPHSALL